MYAKSTTVLVVASTLALGACGGGERASSEKVGDAAEELGAFTGQIADLGPLAFGSDVSASYTGEKRYSGYSFAAVTDTFVHVHVGSTTGDAMVWLLDDHLRIMKVNDDTNASTLDAALGFHLAAGTYHVVFRDYARTPGTFRVNLDGYPAMGPPAPKGGGAPPPPPPAPTCTSTTAASFTSCAEANFNYLADNGGFDSRAELGQWQQPPGVRAWMRAFFSKNPGENASPSAYTIPAGGKTAYAITFGEEEVFWAYLIDRNGALLAEGGSGDSCCQVNGWTPTITVELDPFRCTTGTSTTWGQPGVCEF